MVRRKGDSQRLGTPAIHLTRACLASCRGNLAYDFLMSVRPVQFIMPQCRIARRADQQGARRLVLFEPGLPAISQLRVHLFFRHATLFELAHEI